MSNLKMNMKHHLQTPILEIESSCEGLFRFKLEAPEIAPTCKPGQFVNIKVANMNFPLLRRPISIHDSDGKNIFEIVFRVVGTGTAILAERRVGDTIDLYGPLGTPFDIIEDKHALLVGGGVGIPPIHNLFREIKRHGLPHTVICGVRNKAEIGLAGTIPNDADDYVICTDDGSMGHHGFVTQPLAERINKNSVIYACGPRTDAQRNHRNEQGAQHPRANQLRTTDGLRLRRLHRLQHQNQQRLPARLHRRPGL